MHRLPLTSWCLKVAQSSFSLKAPLGTCSLRCSASLLPHTGHLTTPSAPEGEHWCWSPELCSHRGHTRRCPGRHTCWPFTWGSQGPCLGPRLARRSTYSGLPAAWKDPDAVRVVAVRPPPVLACKGPATATQSTSKTRSDHRDNQIRGKSNPKAPCICDSGTILNKLGARHSPNSQGRDFLAILPQRHSVSTSIARCSPAGAGMLTSSRLVGRPQMFTRWSGQSQGLYSTS